MEARNLAQTARALWAQGKYIAASHVWRRAMQTLINERKGYFIMENTFVIEQGELTINVSVVCYECNDGFDEQWEGTDKHKGGVTITNPEADRNSWKYFIPKQYTLAELAASYAHQGRGNPSSAAYQSLQDQLQRDIYACDYGFNVSAYIGDVEVLGEDTSIGCGFDHSEYDEEDLITTARRVWDENVVTEEVIAMCKESAAKIVAACPALTAFIN